MTYARLRLVLLIGVALLVVAGPATAAMQKPVQYGRITRPPAAAPVVATPPSPAATPTGSADSEDRPVRSRPPSSSGPGQPGGGPGSAKSSSPAQDPAFGPAGSDRRTGSPVVALTFDDGPDPENTPKILDVLKQYGVKATFCVVGFRARDHPDLIRRIVAEGHTLCNHSWQHLLNLANRPVDYIRWDLAKTNEAIRAAVPDAKISYFRAPGGNFTRGLVGLAHGYGMASIYWQCDPRDWEHKGESDAAHVSHVIAEVQRCAKPGAIVLSHDNAQPDTTEAYRTLLPWLKARFTLSALPT
jgi:peptidoglycan/xylan/chitin deacetylase (PgdA/CDA1 family)